MSRLGSELVRASLTIYSGGQQCGYDLALSFLVLVQEALEAVKYSTAQNKRLSLVHH